LSIEFLSYYYYIPKVSSHKIDCDHCVAQNCPSHSHIATLIEHILDDSNALMFWMWMKLLKMECLQKETGKRNQLAFETPPDYIDSALFDKFKGE